METRSPVAIGHLPAMLHRPPNAKCVSASAGEWIPPLCECGTSPSPSPTGPRRCPTRVQGCARGWCFCCYDGVHCVWNAFVLRSTFRKRSGGRRIRAMTAASSIHVPVMLAEVLDGLSPSPVAFLLMARSAAGGTRARWPSELGRAERSSPWIAIRRPSKRPPSIWPICP